VDTGSGAHRFGVQAAAGAPAAAAAHVRSRPPSLAAYRARSARSTSWVAGSRPSQAATPIEQVHSGGAVRSRSAISMALSSSQSGSSTANSSPP
jgi:hypothetical protein